jgi:thiol-disulfide isomerase/thioredoxin
MPSSKFIRTAIVLSLFIANIANAQIEKPDLAIGDKIPDIQIKNIINYTKHTASISDFKGTPIILDFWASWCGPCIAAFPKLDSLQRKFKDNLQILLITKESKIISERLLTSLKKVDKQTALPVVTEDSIMNSLFNPIVVPHYIWLDGNGTIKAITGAHELTEENVENFIKGYSIQLPIKKDSFVLSVGEDRPVFTNNSLTSEKDIIYQSVLTKYIQGFGTAGLRGVHWNWIRCLRHPYILLAKCAFGNFSMEYINNNRVILEGFKNQEDSLAIGRFTSKNEKFWEEIQYDKLYNYELVIPDSNKQQLFAVMQDEINRLFKPKGLHASREKRDVSVLVLVKTSGIDKIKSKGGRMENNATNFSVRLRNAPVSAFISKLQSSYFKEDALPIGDETGYKEKVDIDISADLEDISAVNKELEKYDLKFVEKKRQIDMIVIRKQ